MLRQCGSFNGNNPASTAPGDWDTECIKSTEQVQCEDFNGQWNTTTNTCENVLGTKDSSDVPIPIADGEVLIIRDGVTWQIIGLIENEGEIHIEKNGAIVLPAGIISNRATASIINDGLIALDIDKDNLGTYGSILNSNQISNYGTIDDFSGGLGFIYGNGGYVDNFCGSVYTVDLTPPFADQNIVTDYLCPPPPPESDNDGVIDSLDAFPYDINEDTDSDNDGVGDAFPLNKLENKDSDGDCGFIITQTLDSGNVCGDNSDAFPDDLNEILDSDDDGVGDNADSFPNDGDNVRMIAVDSSNGWSLMKGFFSTSAIQEPLPDGLPAGVDLPLGFVVLEMSSGTIGTSAEITLTYPDAIDPALAWWKYGRTASNNEPHWYMFDDAVIDGNTVTLTIKDGGFGDDDLVENGIIVDPGGLGPREPVVTNISTSSSGGGSVSPWLLLLLSGFYGLRARRKEGSTGGQRQSLISPF